MDNPLDQTARETIHTLALRLRRIEYLLFGSQASSTSDPSSAPIIPDPSTLNRENSIRAGMDHLDKALLGLYNQSPIVKSILDLYIRFPHLFTDPTLPTSLPQYLFPPHPPQVELSSPLSLQEKLSTVLSTASSFQSFSSQLNSIMDSPIPNPRTSAELIGLLPRINKLELLQAAHQKEIAELRKRSAKALERWYLIGVEGVNECAAEWDERTLDVEKELSRIERTVIEEEDLVGKDLAKAG